MAPTIQILGAYRVELTQKLFLHALEVKYAGLGLQGDECRQAEKATLEELSCNSSSDSSIFTMRGRGKG